MKKSILVIIISIVLVTLFFMRNNGDENSLTVARCIGYCNLPLFLASESNNDELTLSLLYIANPGEHGNSLSSRAGAEASVTPFTNVITAYASGAPIKIIAGSGMNGLALVGRPEIRSIDDLKGKKIGTFRGDTLEILAQESLRKAGLSSEVEFIFFTDGFEALTALKEGDISAITHVEPFVSMLVEKENMNVIETGEHLWHADHPDCVLVASETVIVEKRALLKELIYRMLLAQYEIEKEIEPVALRLAEPFYQMEPAQLIKAVKSQFPAIDIRGKEKFIIEKGETLVSIGYIQKPIDENIFDFSILEEVLKENPKLYDRIQNKYGTRSE